MEISRSDGNIVLSRLDVFFIELLRQISSAADPQGFAPARERLLSPPSSDAKFNEDWESYVRPDLQHLFQTALETIGTDIGKLEKSDAEEGADYTLRIPIGHADAWLNGLNQARLVIAARHAFTDKEMEVNGPLSLATVRDLGLYQIHFYGFLQECFLREMNG